MIAPVTFVAKNHLVLAVCLPTALTLDSVPKIGCPGVCTRVLACVFMRVLARSGRRTFCTSPMPLPFCGPDFSWTASCFFLTPPICYHTSRYHYYLLILFPFLFLLAFLFLFLFLVLFFLPLKLDIIADVCEDTAAEERFCTLFAQTQVDARALQCRLLDALHEEPPPRHIPRRHTALGAHSLTRAQQPWNKHVFGATERNLKVKTHEPQRIFTQRFQRHALATHKLSAAAQPRFVPPGRRAHVTN
mmetsp:Transcript_80802/g.130969  ORF Transcript_80802/g.130969 Transcript_80802/m.130969 type:complete len:246 (-) Transcript_80802:336-1073(-)